MQRQSAAPATLGGSTSADAGTATAHSRYAGLWEGYISVWGGAEKASWPEVFHQRLPMRSDSLAEGHGSGSGRAPRHALRDPQVPGPHSEHNQPSGRGVGYIYDAAGAPGAVDVAVETGQAAGYTRDGIGIRKRRRTAIIPGRFIII